MPKIALAEILENLGAELKQASEKAKTGKPIMQFKECEVELAIETEREGEGKVKIWVAELGGAVKKTESNSIRIKFAALSEAGIVAYSPVPGPAPKPKRQTRRER